MSRAPLPPPLPPETRTVGQLVAETLRLYGRRFWRSLALGLPVAAVNMLAVELPREARLIVIPVVSGVVLTLVLVAACMIAFERRPESLGTALAGGFVVFLLFPLLVGILLLPGFIWLALFGLIVPAAVSERLSLRQGFARALALSRAGFVHTLGSLATLAIVVFLTQATLLLLLQTQGEQAAQIASFLAGTVVSPVLFLGVALLYVDQEARYRVKT